jgi:hypothetical protein
MSLRGQALFLSSSELEHVLRKPDLRVDKSREIHADITPTPKTALAVPLWTIDGIFSVF